MQGHPGLLPTEGLKPEPPKRGQQLHDKVQALNSGSLIHFPSVRKVSQIVFEVPKTHNKLQVTSDKFQMQSLTL